MQVPTAAIFTTTAKRLATGNGKNPNRKASKKSHFYIYIKKK